MIKSRIRDGRTTFCSRARIGQWDTPFVPQGTRVLLADQPPSVKTLGYSQAEGGRDATFPLPLPNGAAPCRSPATTRRRRISRKKDCVLIPDLLSGSVNRITAMKTKSSLLIVLLTTLSSQPSALNHQLSSPKPRSLRQAHRRRR